MWKLIVALFLLASAALAQDAPRITAVNYPLQYMTQRLVGDAAVVEFPVPAGVDPSFWRPGISDISAVQSSDLIVLNGAGFATWTDRVSLPRSRTLNSARLLKHRFIKTETITHSHGDGGTHSHEGVASYTWLDPGFADAQAESIASALIARGIAPEAEVTANLAVLRDDLMGLEQSAEAALAPARGMAMIATHPRYHYLAARYDLQIASLEWEAGAAPTEAQLTELEALMTETNAKILIWEAAPPQSALDAAAALGLQNVVFNPLAQRPPAGDFTSGYRAAVELLGTAARAAAGG